MKFTPKKTKKARFVALALMVAGMAAWMLSLRLSRALALFLWIIAFFCFLFSYTVLYRYEWTNITYLLTARSFVISRRVGKREETVCNLPLASALAVMPTPNRKQRKQLAKTYGNVAVRYNQKQSMLGKKAYSVFFCYYDRIAEVVFEPDEALAAKMKAAAAENEDAWVFSETNKKL